MTRRWLLIALLIVTGRSAQAAVDADKARAMLVAAICAAGDPAIIATGSAASKPITFYADGTVDPAGERAWPGRQLSFSRFDPELIVRVAVAITGKERVVACGAVAPNEYLVLPAGLSTGSILHIDIYESDINSIDQSDLTTEVQQQLGLLDDQRKDKLVAACSLEYVSHQELLYADMSARFYTVPYSAATEQTFVPAEEPLWLSITDVPTAIDLSISQKRGDGVGFTLESLAKTALTVLPRLLPFKAVTLIEDHGAPTCEPPSKPSAVTGQRVFQLGELDRYHLSTVSICEGKTCPGDKDANVRGTVRLEPSPKGRWTLMTELSVGFGLWGGGRASGFDGFGFGAQAVPTFEPILGAGGPEQVFELREQRNPRNAFTTSLLLGAHLSDHWFLGAGPSLTIGTTGAALGQLSGRFGYGIRNSGVYFTFGIAARFVDAPEFYEIGDRVTLAQPAGMAVTAPKFASHTAVLLQADVGIAIDLGRAVSGASNLISAFGGPR